MLPDELFLGIHMYGVMIAVGLIAAFMVLFYYSKKKNIDSKLVDFVFYDGVVSIAFGFLSAALFQALYKYIEDPSRGFRFGEGITFIGGFIGGAVCFLVIYFIFRKRLKINLLDILSVIPCSILIAHAFGRIGCFFAGCCYGKETNSFLGVQFPHLPNPVYPTQLFEAAFLLILFCVCSYLVLKKDFKYNLSVYLVGYGIFRFLIEFLRGDDRGAFLGGIISPSQFWSLLMVVIGALLFVIMYKQEQNKTLALAKEQLSKEEAETSSQKIEQKPKQAKNKTKESQDSLDNK